MWNTKRKRLKEETRRKRLKEAIEKLNAKKAKLDEQEYSDEEPEDVEDGDLEDEDLEPLPKVFPGIPQLKLEEIHKMASKYSDTNVRLSIKAKDAERITRELIDLRDEVLRLRQCVPANNSFDEKSLVDSNFLLDVPSEMGDIEIHNLEDL